MGLRVLNLLGEDDFEGLVEGIDDFGFAVEAEDVDLTVGLVEVMHVTGFEDGKIVVGLCEGVFNGTFDGTWVGFIKEGFVLGEEVTFSNFDGDKLGFELDVGDLVTNDGCHRLLGIEIFYRKKCMQIRIQHLIRFWLYRRRSTCWS